MSTKFIGLLLCGLSLGAIINLAGAQETTKPPARKVKTFKLKKTAPTRNTETDATDSTDSGANISLDYTIGGTVDELDGTDVVPNVGLSGGGKKAGRPVPSGVKLKFADKPKKLDLSKAVQYNTRYAFPYSGTDLARRAYIVTTKHAAGIQKYGFDISMREWRTSGYLKNSWSPLAKGVSKAQRSSNPTDEQSLIYKQPIYAMADGQVMACWRNTEENPRPYSKAQGDSLTMENGDKPTCEQSPWLHPKLCSGHMPGGGNELWIKQANDVFALYAHMAPGTIPASLCPHNGIFFPTPSTELELPNFAPEIAVTNGAMIKKGQYLGKTGNSGSSTSPHLHIHMEKDLKSVPIKFEGGLYANLPAGDYKSNTKADEKFAAFSDSTLPVATGKTTFVWPNRKNKYKFNRKNVEARHYQANFNHLKQSGMWPGLVTCKHIPYINKYTYDFINWVKAPKGAKWYGKHGLSTIKFAVEINKAKANGYKITSSYTCGNSLQNQKSVVIFKKQ